MLSTAAFLSLALQCASTVHPDTAQDIARIESGFNPYAIGVVGQKKGLFPTNKEDALKHVKRLRVEGKNFSVGLMQINQANFKQYGVDAAALFTPCVNLSVFEKIITDCYQRGKTLKRALSCYYSGNFVVGQKKESEFGSTSYTERAGYTPAPRYVVPSTKTDKANTSPDKAESPAPSTTPKTRRIVYPSQLVRGEFVDLTALNGE
ncbi:transglycosylase SLT domain protein (plasmid) [Yersinia pseudotuberculosis IP 32953]|uniref:TriA protein n=1 Tax=Yersinia pseudotuberculosis serotype I (strain IP32953) TaxID=273123 RepID=Q663F0_YERPS|nr:lytic transglycosylase domain-containing protein [Yersinia pseudotuberculosis]AJJ53090.1 transglycosylase SLT domain protein [Yersinia pseudotuberculosis IP 32953]BET64949.1 lytic transglycosylase domain-containing protein [Yersinia pseudotuberculosis]CAF25446.1 TriA protein [Yersinia pseudotuberculosis IP 32953]